MDLQFALFLLGVVVVFLVFAMSRYSDLIEKWLQAARDKFSRLRAAKSAARSRAKSVPSARVGDADHAPSLGDAHQVDQFEEQQFEFESDSFADPLSEDRGAELEPPSEKPETEPEVERVEHSSAVESNLSPSIPKQGGEAEHDRPLASLVEEHESRIPVGPFTSLRQIDFWIKLSPVSPVTQVEVLTQLTHWDKIKFPVQLHALTQKDSQWVNLLEAQGDTAIVDVVASYQLLKSGQAASIDDLNTFDEQTSALGLALKAEKLMMASAEQAREQSLKLAQFFADSCEPLEVSICAPEGQAFMGKLVETSAKQQGLDYMDGEYVRQKRMASHNIVLYRMLDVNRRHASGDFDKNMSSDAKIECVKFTMMPVLSRTPGRDAKEMLDAVKAFASRVKGDIRVPGESEFHQDLLLQLRNRVSRLEKNTIAAGLEPGGQEIYRIFS